MKFPHLEEQFDPLDKKDMVKAVRLPHAPLLWQDEVHSIWYALGVKQQQQRITVWKNKIFIY